MEDEQAFPPTGFAVAWFKLHILAFVICKEFVVFFFFFLFFFFCFFLLLFFFLPSLFCHLGDWMVSL